MPRPFDLSVIIPVFDAARTIERLVDEFLAIDELTVEMILVDDASADGSTEIVRRLGERERVTAKFHRRNRGAGIARNTGFGGATGRYTIFFDADDIVHPHAVVVAVGMLDESGADTAVLPYRYRRDRSSEREPMNGADIDIWAEYVTQGAHAHRIGVLDDFPRLLGFSNYPWNKIVRTAHFREAGLRYGSTPVNNDILGHWYSLLFARTILLIDVDICTHIVETGGANLSNRHSQVRLALFDALDETYDLLERHPGLRNRYSHVYWAFVVRVAAWARTRITDELANDFKFRLQQHLLRVNLSDLARMRLRRDPSLADALLERSLS